MRTVITLEVTYRDGRFEIIEIPEDRRFQDLRQYFNALSVEVLRVIHTDRGVTA